MANSRFKATIIHYVMLSWAALAGFELTTGTILVSMTILTSLFSIWLFPTTEEEIPSYRVAFLGNSITFVNDLPRFMEALANATNDNTKHLIQDSCLHGSLSFRSFLQKGNGMYHKWQTTNAIIPNTSLYYSHMANSSMINPDAIIYDYGACTVNQLFFGYDEDLTVKNSNGKYRNDGMNPCIKDKNYYYYLQAKYEYRNSLGKIPSKWDFVVMNDQTVYPGIVSKRKRSLKVLTTKYAKLFKKLKTARPVFLATYGYMKASYQSGQQQQQDAASDDDTTANADYNYDTTYDTLGSMEEFTSRIWYGYQQYAKELGALLPASQQPIIAPVGPAFLMLYEENLSLWDKMFYDDGYHPSPHGSFLIGCVLYATLYGRLPSSNIFDVASMPYSSSGTYNNDDSVSDDQYTIAHLWKNARKMQMSDMGSNHPYPTIEEAKYLLYIAERVVFYGDLPSTLLSSDVIEAIEEQEAAYAASSSTTTDDEDDSSSRM